MMLVIWSLVLGAGPPAAARSVAAPTLTSSSEAAAEPKHTPHAGSDAARRSGFVEQAPVPPDGDGDRDRIMRMQEALRDILRGSALRRLRVGIRVMEARTGRLFFEKRGTVLMDPASNQKVLATTTAIMRLGADWRFRTELAVPLPDDGGWVAGDVVLRGSGDPTVKSSDLQTMAADLARRGITRIDGAVVADPRRIGADEPIADGLDDGDGQPQRPAEKIADEMAETPQRNLPARGPLVVDHGLLIVRVRPGTQVGAPAEVVTSPSDPSFVILNRAHTKASGTSSVSVRLSMAGGRIQVEVAGRIAVGRASQAFRRRVPQQALYSAVLLRAALAAAGIAVRDPSRLATSPPPPRAEPTLMVRHESAPLSVLLRRINKDSDNDQAERVLEAAGAEVYGGAPTPDKGVRLVREVIGELGLPPGTYVPRNGSGLGHANRITADAMADLLRSLYLDPRIGPEILQSLSVGGVDGTTRNRFKNTLAARRVRAKTGTLSGKSCLSGLVGDGTDILVFSILVDGLQWRSLRAVRGAQVGCVNAMMRYVREAHGNRLDLAPDNAEPAVTPDYELGGEFLEMEGESTESEDAVDAFLKKERGEKAVKDSGGARSPSPLPPSRSSTSPPPSAIKPSSRPPAR
jgi:D-alanyl-D-alanine carboxypeptidase/D-alanyl-D-alanine-endopeptidase (penicillin-binding protein 4)